ITIIGRGHGGTRAMSQTLCESGVYMGAQLNASYDLVPAEDLYEACRVMSRHVVPLGGVRWDFSKLLTMPIDPEFIRLVESYLASVLSRDSEHKGWKLPETTLIYPWIVRMFPEVRYIHWTRDPRDSILGAHLTDDLADFGIPYEPTDDDLLKRAISWKYQREIVKATPQPKYTIDVRFEDFVLNQDETLKRIEAFVGFPLAKIEARRDSVGRWKSAADHRDFDFLRDDMVDLGYE
ncbi:MAG TPA: sulfotransferase, partial [Armatimonadota bacterium]|nr:sulfotransferase [Armatimonadota bacterium]